jgi:endonuclease/exonuclease/phosphatase family metal-dependent hydrolase
MTRVARPAVLALAMAAVWWGAPGTTETMAQPAPTLKYLSYNILHGGALSGWSGNGEDLEARFRLAVEELRRLDPDIVGVQEASVTRRRGNVAERLARELGLSHVYTPALFRLFPFAFMNRHVSWLMNFEEGPAVLSRYPIVDWEAHGLPRCAGFADPRALVYARIRTPWGDLGVASTHTSRGFCEVERVIELMQARRGALPSVLMGDFNSREDSPAIRRLIAAGFVDTFRAANPAAPGLTVWQRVRAPAPTVFARVDYAFLLPGGEVPGKVVASRVVLDAPHRLEDGTVLWPSDHYGVLTELDVFGSPPAGMAGEPEPVPPGDPARAATAPGPPPATEAGTPGP